MKKLINKLLYVLAVAALIALTAFAGKRHSQRICPAVDIKIDYGHRKDAPDILLVLNDVRQAITLNFDSLKGRPLSEINIERIEKTMSKINYAKQVEVFGQIDGKVVISLKQRRPIARIYGSGGHEFYIDESGTVMPVRFGYPARVLPFTGNIDDRFYEGNNVNINSPAFDSVPGAALLRNIYRMAKYIDGNKFLKEEITQVNIAGDGTITMIPLVGRHTIEMLSFDNTEEKLHKLEIFYKKGLRTSGWGKYKKINIEYKNQIVCTKI